MLHQWWNESPVVIPQYAQPSRGGKDTLWAKVHNLIFSWDETLIEMMLKLMLKLMIYLLKTVNVDEGNANRNFHSVI